VKRGCSARNARSNAGRSEKSGGFGKTPCVKAKLRMSTPIITSKTISTANVAATAG
jgi:hypothetical protein